MFIKKHQNKLLVLLIILGVALFFFFRLYRLSENLNFYVDQADLLRMTKESWGKKEPTLIGPFIPSIEYQGRSIFYGAAYNYMTLIPALITNWDPLSISISIVFLQFIAIALSSWFIGKRLGSWFGLLFFFICSSLPLLIRYSNFIWNPNYGIILSFLAIFVIELIEKKCKSFYFLLLGVWVGLTLQLHYLYFLTVPFIVIYAFKKGWKKTIPPLLLGLLIGYLNMVVFEFRNNFYNFRTIFYILGHFGKSGARFNIADHYYAIFIPYLMYISFNVLARWKKYKKSILITGYTLVVILAPISLRRSVTGYRYGILPYWAYQDQLKVVGIILTQNDRYYNVANLIYADTRELPIRYLLELKGQEIMPVDAYPRTDTLYVTSMDNPLTHNVYEMDSIKPGKIEKTWDVSGNIKLYKIIRI